MFMVASLPKALVSSKHTGAAAESNVVKALVSARLWGESSRRAANETASNDRECLLHAARGGHKMHAKMTLFVGFR
jgi:hypothetical protein